MCSLSTTVNNHSTEEADVVQHSEETFEDRIVIFFFFLSSLFRFTRYISLDCLMSWNDKALYSTYLYSTLHFTCKIIFVIDVKLYVEKKVQVVLYLSIDFGNQTGEETAA